IEVLRIADFTNPSPGSVEDELIWPLCQVRRPGVEPGDLVHWPVTL
ncbi:hypothetical protein U9M48_028647, partial [Paspalum notatum var. saurae]